MPTVIIVHPSDQDAGRPGTHLYRGGWPGSYQITPVTRAAWRTASQGQATDPSGQRRSEPVRQAVPGLHTGEEGGRFCQYVALLAQHAHFTTQVAQFLAFG